MSNILQQVQKYTESLESYKTKIPTIEQLQELAATLWELNIKYSESPKSNDPAIQNALNNAFNRFSLLLDSAWHVDASLIEPYSRLVSCRNLLTHLRTRGVYSNAEVARIQREVNDIESKFFKSGKFIATDSTGKDVAMGQAVLSSMLHHCHRLSTVLLEANEPVNQFLLPTHQKLVRIKSEIANVDVKGLQVLQSELKQIEDAKKYGLFVPKDWNAASDPHAIPEGQAECQALLEECYDLIYDRLCEGEKSELSEKIVAAGNSAGGFEYLQKYIWDGLGALQNLASNASNEAIKLGYAIAKGYSQMNKHLVKNMAAVDVVDPKLSNVMAEIQSILTGLKRVRVEVLFLSKTGTTKIEQGLRTDLSEKLQALRVRLNAVDSKRVNGRFVGDDGAFAPKGQAVLASMLEEGYAIVHEIDIVLN